MPRQDSTTRMPFGRFRGKLLADLPTDYLEWVSTIDLRPWLRTAVQAELDQRAFREPRQENRGRGCPEQVVAESLITAGLRVLARQHHPDVGGTHSAMLQVNAAADWLRAAVRGLSA